jgi:Rps23 Pro-64 3,4-dihydroxylase Tpa1-like proline 4-hydroxylase
MINPNISLSFGALSTQYLSAENYPHIVLDNFVDPTLWLAVSNEAQWLSENAKQESWRFGTPDEHVSQILKRGITEFDKMTPSMALACTYFNSDTFVNYLRQLTGIQDLVSDWTLEGGGFHVTYPGGKLDVHHDFNFTDTLGPERLYRKVNLLVYLNQNWEKEWGGHLELWKSDLSGAFNVIDLKYNRAVLFNIEDAPHGHPDPLACPQGESRRSLAFYYYSKEPVKNRLYDRAHWLVGNELI